MAITATLRVFTLQHWAASRWRRLRPIKLNSVEISVTTHSAPHWQTPSFQRFNKLTWSWIYSSIFHRKLGWCRHFFQLFRPALSGIH